ncbi:MULTISPECIES: flagellar motor switch protein FliN [unclassified Arthrobacter]|uniref:flagellar motor switch protein FliN n=1 Tax=unclassified Arthrobacter TaxID=235627 RepID=UPI002E01C534|nr:MULTISPECIES: flagellar motor switch protein FliN [unclassified Arthrobacter]MEC5192929.1 flagellar motor switch protein FliN/FliY [Arthrobacter sp. MP_M4]MEC5204458.1 flagellar motor switch protein FliN/FliY [Arthrobacter sp. MP_M7]
MSITLTRHESSAERLVEELPSPVALKVLALVPARAAAPYARQAVTATFVGSVTADLALMLSDRTFLDEAAGGMAGAQPGVVSVTDVLRPAMESASSVFGAGVLSDLRESDASGLLSDPDTAVFELSDGINAAAWFAVRLREHSTGQDRAGDLFAAGGDAVAGRLGRINNIEMALTVEIGRTRMSVRDVLSLEPGKIIELDRSAGAPADVLLNGRLIAHGEVVVLDQDYAVRITRILDVAEGLS